MATRVGTNLGRYEIDAEIGRERHGQGIATAPLTHILEELIVDSCEVGKGQAGTRNYIRNKSKFRSRHTS